MYCLATMRRVGVRVRHLSINVCWLEQHAVRQTRRAFSSLDNSDDDNVQTSRDYCVDLVFRNDYQSYLMGLLFPAKHRNAYFAIKAFNVEVATIKDQIPKSAVQSGRLRFNFWRDILKQIDQKKDLPKHINQPVALELLDQVRDYDLNVRFLERCLEAR
jgi:NADH dehydrogenase [ubiquinone] 1 alpha subcomplex assembly factor 6